MRDLSRRGFIGLVGGAAAWPMAARAQQPGTPVVGFLRNTPSASFEHILGAFRRGLTEAGYVEGRNVVIEQRWAEGHNDRLPTLLTDLINRQAAVIVANTTAALAAKAGAVTVPVVFATGTDPVRDGLVASFNRPGVNFTGVVFITSELGTKRLELLRQLVPKATTVGMLVMPSGTETEVERVDVAKAAQALGFQLVVANATSRPEIETAFAAFAQQRADAALIGTGAQTNSHSEAIVALAARHSIPTIYSLREYVSIGGLMSYGASITEAYRQAGIYAGRILKGERPADLPVMRSTKFDLVLNLRTAKALGLDVPDKLLALTDEVIE
jgi:putative tryptophan/tyrosine transport system substrate-binding protein